jgi:hypothetical protein
VVLAARPMAAPPEHKSATRNWLGRFGELQVVEHEPNVLLRVLLSLGPAAGVFVREAGPQPLVLGGWAVAGPVVTLDIERGRL